MATKAGIDKQVLAFGKVENTDKQYLPLRVDTLGHLIIPISIPTAESLAISGGVITPTLPSGLYANLSLSGEGGVADDLTEIVLPSTWIGKIIIIHMANAGNITMIVGSHIRTKTNFTLDSIYDNSVWLVIGVNEIEMISRSDNA
ncbi:MAG: hypothetical protein WC998_06195 [Candidatus Paceibacterota bacterium]|jgi:hypothetical protein